LPLPSKIEDSPSPQVPRTPRVIYNAAKKRKRDKLEGEAEPMPQKKK